MKKLFGFGLPDMGKLTEMFDARFKELIEHIDALGVKLDALHAELRTQRGAPQ